LHDGSGAVVVSNDDWKIPQETAIGATGLAPGDDHESAILLILQPGSYTVIESGKNGTTGVGLIELYDLDAAANAHLTNISTRGFVQTGANVMIGGFIVSGANGSLNLIVRALGPSLAQFGVPTPLADPNLRLYDSNGTLIRLNDNCKDTEQTAIENTGFQPPNNLDSAILVTLPTGNYTAIVNGKNGGTGIGLVEVYRLP